MRLELAVQVACARRGLPHRRSIARWIGAALATERRVPGARLTVRFVGQAEGRALNRAFRAKDYATNVLTFGYQDVDATPLAQRRSRANRRGASSLGADTSRAIRRARTVDPMPGDIVLCAPVVQREAREQGKKLSAHYAHLVIHGTLHLLGYQHDREAEAQHMERLETRLLRALGYSDPYA